MSSFSKEIKQLFVRKIHLPVQFILDDIVQTVESHPAVIKSQPISSTLGRRLQVWVKQSAAQTPLKMVVRNEPGAGMVVCNSQLPAGTPIEFHGVLLNSGKRLGWEEELENIQYTMLTQLKLKVRTNIETR